MATSTTSATSLASATGATTAASGSASASTSQIFANYSAFLTLLTTQLQHQDPLNPTDTAQYTQQLVEYASVEQEMKSNDTLTSINTAVSGNEAVNALGYVGKTVIAEMGTTQVSNGEGDWEYKLASASSSTQLTVKDSSGNTVYQGTGGTASGLNTFTWNGTETDGSTAPDGTYTLSVNAVDSSGNAIAATTYAKGTVTGIDSSSGTAQLVVGGNLVAIANILSVNGATTTATS